MDACVTLFSRILTSIIRQKEEAACRQVVVSMVIRRWADAVLIIVTTGMVSAWRLPLEPQSESVLPRGWV